jgi:hypothetical protein
MALKLMDNQQADVVAIGLNAVGNKVSHIYGPTVWTVSDPTLLDVISVGDFGAQIVTKGPMGTCQLMASAWADPGKSTEINGTLDIEIVASPASSLMIEVSNITVR